MRLTVSAVFVGAAIFLTGNSATANPVSYVINRTSHGYSESTLEVFSATQSGTELTLTKIATKGRPSGSNFTEESKSYFSPSENKLYLYDSTAQNFQTYDITNDTWSTNGANGDDLSYTYNQNNATQDPGPTFKNISTKGSITELSITSKSDGIHIGKNSFVIGNDVVNGAHPIWATDENGTKIPLNIDGSDLQINGVSVQGQITTNKNNINNLGEGVANSTALTAALTALPQASTDSKLSCGVGTGTYSSSYALGVGCASKVNERVDVNFGGSYVGGGSKDYGSGSLENVAAKAGFVFKLGKISKPTLISMKEKKGMQAKITELSASNTKIQTQNKELQATVDGFESKNQELSELVAWQNNQIKIQNQRLEKIEQIALANQKDEKTAFSFLNASNLFSSMRSFLTSSN